MEKLELNRRWFFGGAAAAASGLISVLPLGSRTISYANGYGTPGMRRVSTVKGDAGEYLYGACNADSKKIATFLDGVEQNWAITSDEGLGFVTRYVESPDGNLCINYATNEVLQETVYGKVVITIT